MIGLLGWVTEKSTALLVRVMMQFSQAVGCDADTSRSRCRQDSMMVLRRYGPRLCPLMHPVDGDRMTCGGEIAGQVLAARPEVNQFSDVAWFGAHTPSIVDVLSTGQDGENFYSAILRHAA